MVGVLLLKPGTACPGGASLTKKGTKEQHVKKAPQKSYKTETVT